MAYDLNRIPDEIEDIRYCVFDVNDPEYYDYFFVPLIFLESFYSPAMVLEIGSHKIQMPLDWSVVACDEEYSDIEILPLTALNDRGFNALTYNPLTDSFPTPHEIDVVDVYAEVKWFFPKLRNGTLLVVPLEEGPNPDCAMFVKNKNKALDKLDVAELFT